MKVNGDLMPECFWAHSRNSQGHRQPLEDHLESVSRLAGSYASAFEAAGLARAAGLWHDVGKYDPAWQRYLLNSEAGQHRPGTQPDHRAAGTQIAAERCELLAFLVAGHHGGLMDASSLKEQVAQWAGEGVPEEALRRVPSGLIAAGTDLPTPNFLLTERDADFFIRILFSTLVDADYLDTEGHFEPERQGARAEPPSLEELWARFAAYHASLPKGSGPIASVRNEVYKACLNCAVLSPGIFRLTVPTGGGKTLSGMAFAIRHALHWGLDRVIFAVPYTSITEQTAGVYREALGEEGVVLEHHSSLDPARVDDQTSEGLWGRLASENWEARVVVTTTVQLFESLFAAKTSKCRKLHRVTRSVIVLDEAQALPSHLLDPILDAIRSLAERYGTSVVLCTATQPALDEAPGFTGLAGAREIAPDPPRMFSMLRRVAYELPVDKDGWTWERAAEEMRREDQALCIMNTIADASALFEALSDSSALYLSALLCGAHRQEVLKEVRRRLAAGEPCRLVSTQAVEAGVDIDFPLVLRAAGPLDRIVQAAGRCNREARLDVGRVVIFRPREGRMPPGTYRTAADLTEAMLSKKPDLHEPSLYEDYFRRLFGLVDLDEERIQNLRTHLRFRTVADHFRMIREDTESVAVPYDGRATRLIEETRSARFLSRELLRRLQPYLVSVRRRLLETYQKTGLATEVREGLFEWLGEYDEREGLVAENAVLVA